MRAALVERARPEGAHEVDLALPANERVGDDGPFGRRAERLQGEPRLHRLDLSLGRDRVERLVPDGVAGGPIRLLSCDQATLGRSGLQAGRSVDDVADGERLAATFSRNGNDCVAGVDRCTRLEIESMSSVQLFQALENGESSPNSTLRVVAVGEGSAEDGHHRVTGEFLHGASVLLDPPPGFRVVEPQGLANVLGVGAIGSRREADEVDEQHRDELALLAGSLGPLELRPTGAAEPRARGLLRPTARAPGLDRHE